MRVYEYEHEHEHEHCRIQALPQQPQTSKMYANLKGMSARTLPAAL
jgi:hypothetical protein